MSVNLITVVRQSNLYHSGNDLPIGSIEVLSLDYALRLSLGLVETSMDTSSKI